MSMIIEPRASSTGRPAPTAAAMGCSIRYTSRTPADWAASRTALVSTSVMPAGMEMTTRDAMPHFRWLARWMKYLSIASVTWKSAMTPSRMGRMAEMLPGVLPSISLASRPTATTFLESVIATTEGSLSTMPRPRT